MALVLGTSAGFVTVAPTSDPASSNTFTTDNRMSAQLDMSPANATTIIEVGWYCDNATEESNFEVGLYSDAGNSEPETRLFVSATNAKGTDAGWKRVTGLSWSISPSTSYWIAIQVVNTATTTLMNREVAGGGLGLAQTAGISTLPSDWGTADTTAADDLFGIYAITVDLKTSTQNLQSISGVKSIKFG